jgi:hypothetical protein
VCVPECGEDSVGVAKGVDGGESASGLGWLPYRSVGCQNVFRWECCGIQFTCTGEVDDSRSALYFVLLNLSLPYYQNAADAYVAMYAVDALRQLADKLLCRSELAGFSSQGDALRPLSAVLRSSDSPAVRELAAACVAHAVAAHSKRLGSGWRGVSEALVIAAADTSPGEPLLPCIASGLLCVVVRLWLCRSEMCSFRACFTWFGLSTNGA